MLNLSKTNDMSAIIAKEKLVNRNQKHKYRNEAVRAAEFLQHVVDDFVDTVFQAPEQFEYDIIYQEFLDRWKNTCLHLKKNIKPRFKMIVIDEKFFANNYSPENLKGKKFERRALANPDPLIF